MMNKKIFCILIALVGYTSYSQITDDKEILKIAANIEESITNNYLNYTNDLFDYQGFNKLFLAKSDDIIIQSFNRGFEEETKQSLKPGDIIQNEIGENGLYSFLAVKKSGEDTILIFQLLNNDGLNYHELYLSKSSGEYKITDIYNYSRYELLSESIGRIYYRSLFEIFPDKDKSRKLLNYKMIEKYEKKLTSLLIHEKFSQAFKKYCKIPEKYKNDKQLLLLAIKAASYTGETETEILLNRYFNVFNSDKRIYLLPIDGLFSIGVYQKPLVYLNELDKEVGGDPFLNFYRAKIQDEAGNTDLAEAYYTKLNNSLPDLQTGYFSLLELYIQNKNYIAAIGMLDKIESSFGYYKKDLETMLQDYSSFRNSNEFAQWANN